MGQKIQWDVDGQRLFETGVRNGVLYTRAASGAYENGVAWNGLTGVTESPSGAEATALYADDMKYLNLMSAEEFGATIEAYMYPDQFAECDGSEALATGVMIGQQTRKTFGLCYRTAIGNDVDGNEHGFKLHMLYGCLASPSERSYSTVNDSPEAITFSWELKTTPVNVSSIGGKEFKPTALLTVDSTKVDADRLNGLMGVLYGADEFVSTKAYVKGEAVEHEDVIYIAKAATPAGTWDESKWTEITDSVGPRLPLPDEIATILTVPTVG